MNPKISNQLWMWLFWIIVWIAVFFAFSKFIQVISVAAPPLPPGIVPAAPKKPIVMSPKAASQMSGKQMVKAALIVATNKPVTLAWTVAAPTNFQSAIFLQGSTDLTNWIDLGNFPDAAGQYQFTDTNALPSRFYRLLCLGNFQTITNMNIP